MAKKKDLDLFGDDDANATRTQNEFEALLNSTGISARGLSAGDRFRGEILAVTGQEAFISTGTPTDAVMPFSGERPKVGDIVEVIVVRAREAEVLVKEVGKSGSGLETDSLEDAYDMEIPVEGLVTEAVKGGFKVKVQGIAAFCPISQIDWRCQNANDYVGRKYEFIITKWDKGRDLVVSRRKILEQERAASEGEFQNTAQVGDIFSGTIFKIEKYGAFVRLQNGMEGLIPISEMSWSRINHPQEVVSIDQAVQVKLIKIADDGERLKISFSLKEGGTMEDPWLTIESSFPVGAHFDGQVEHKEAFGLFVRLAMGVTGLLPRSAWRDSTDGKEYENKRKGDSIKVKIAKIDSDNRKLSLALPGEDEDDSWRTHSSAVGSKGKSLGTFADLLKGVKVK